MLKSTLTDTILSIIQGRTGETRTDCPSCEGTQKETLTINADSGLYYCQRCGIRGNVKATSFKPFAEWVWEKGIPCTDHPYLDKKKLKAHGLRTNNHNGQIQLIVPYFAYGQITTAQTITGDGSKKSLPKSKGCEIRGASHTIEGNNAGPIYVCEGWATAASVHEATGCTAVSVAQKSNLEISFDHIKARFNGAEIVFCADNDKNGGGLLYAAKAAKRFGAKVVMPEKVGQDFSDIWIEDGADAVKIQLGKFLDLEKVDTEKKDTMVEMEAAGISEADILSAAYAGEKGCADLYIKKFKNIYAKDRASNCWYEFTGNFWEIDKLGNPIRDCDIIQDFCKKSVANISGNIIEISEKMRDCTDEAQQETLKNTQEKEEKDRAVINTLAHHLDNLMYRKHVIDFATYGPDTLGITGEEWDQHPWQLAVKNGIIDLKTGKLKRGTPGDYIKSYCPTIYDPKATCPNFEKFLLEIFDNDVNLVFFLNQLLGAGLIGNGSYKQYVAIFSGVGRNGKDTLMGIIQHVLGLGLAAPIPTELILDGGAGGKRSSQGPSADLMKLRGLRLAYCNETSQGRKFNTGQIKQLSGGGIMTAREPFGKRNVDWEQTHMIFLMTNHKPQAPVDDYAFWKRIKTIHFPLSFINEPHEPHERQADPHLGDKLKEESSGILNFLIQGCLEYQKSGLIEPAAVKSANLQYLKDVDQTGLFIDDCCFIGPDAQVRANHFYGAYKVWSQENSLRPISGTAFGYYATNKFSKKNDNKGTYYKGVGLLTEP